MGHGLSLSLVKHASGQRPGENILFVSPTAASVHVENMRSLVVVWFTSFRAVTHCVCFLSLMLVLFRSTFSGSIFV